MRPIILTVRGKDTPVWLDSEQYAAIVRVRYRKYLRRKGAAPELTRGLRTLPELRALSNLVARAQHNAA